MRRINMLIATLAALTVAGSASAQLQLQMTGEWFSNRGPLVDIPQNGGPQSVGTANPCQLIDGCLNGIVPANGGVPGQGTADVNWNPNGPLPITIPAGVFTQNKVSTPSTNLVPIALEVVQLQTNFEVFAPGIEVGPTATGSPDRVLRANAWTNQTGRLGASFAFCPGPVASTGGGVFEKAGFVTNCTESKASIGPGAYNGIVQYSGNGANNFGGTMAMMLDNGGFVSVIVGTTGGVPIVGHQAIGAPGATGVLRSQVTGGGYALFNTALLQPAVGNVGFMTNVTLGKITTVGPSAGVVIPTSRNFNWGFPFTTGKVSVMDVEQNAQGGNAGTTLTAQGVDNRDAFGRGNITLVAGGLAYRSVFGLSTPALNIVNMTFTPEPGPTLMLATSLLAIGGLYAFLRRRANG